MITHASTYSLSQKLENVEVGDIDIIPKNNLLQMVRHTIRENMHHAYEKNATRYNLRSREVRFLAGQEILRRNFTLSAASKYINSKLCKKFVKCRVLRQVGRSMYELEDLSGRRIGTYHAKDLQHISPGK